MRHLDPRAMGGVNTIAAIEPGASGNVATEDVAHLLDCMGCDTGLDLPGLIEAAGVLERLVEHPLPAQVSRAGVRLKRHLPPLDFDLIVARAHGRGTGPVPGREPTRGGA